WEANRSGEWRPYRPGAGQGNFAESVLRILHGIGAVNEEGWRDYSEGERTGTGARYCHHGSEGGNVASASRDLGTRSPERRRHHRVVAASFGWSVKAVVSRIRRFNLLIQAGRQQSDG